MNQFLESVSQVSRQSLLAACTTVRLPQRTVLHEPYTVPRYAYFLTSGVCSLINASVDGSSAEVGLVGNDGVVNALSVLGPAPVSTQAIIQVSAAGYQIPVSRLRALFRSSEEIRDQLLQGVQSDAFASSQIAGCHRLHGAEQRLARWLLMVHDRVGSEDLHMTQSFLGVLLGTQRPTVTLLVQSMQKRGLLELQRAQIRIADRAKLERSTCECYDVIRRFYAMPFPSAETGKSEQRVHGAPASPAY